MKPPIGSAEITKYIAVRSYLRTSDGIFSRVGGAERPVDKDYIEGAITIDVDGMEVMGLGDWDLVDQLWSYIANMLEKLRHVDTVETYFPDDPIKLRLSRLNRKRWLVEVSSDVKRKAQVDAVKFLHELGSSGDRFFRELSELMPETRAIQESERKRLARAVEALKG